MVRGIGTCVLLIPSTHHSPTAPQPPFSIQLPPNMQLGGSFELAGAGAGAEEIMMGDVPVGSLFSPHHHPPHQHPPPLSLHHRSSLRRKTSSSSSDDAQPSSPTKLATIEAGTSSGSGGIHPSAMSPLKPILSTSVSLCCCYVHVHVCVHVHVHVHVCACVCDCRMCTFLALGSTLGYQARAILL